MGHSTATETAQYNMVYRQVRPWQVLDQRVTDLLATIPRADFVPAAKRALAFSDTQLPIGNGEVMMEPRVEARMLQALNPQPGERALEVGTGSGFITACLAEMCDQVTSVEIDPQLREQALENLATVRSNRRVDVLEGDAAKGWRDGQRYNVIAVTGSLPELHRGFHGSLVIGGRLFVIVGTDPVMEALLITRTGNNSWDCQSLFDTRLPALRGAPAPTPDPYQMP
ncbi:protein-L-isoaspartate O-methyltransferase [Halorhodospira halochloris]|uniref:Protein-L-isoaspartate O-methyltransferase n=1 Tax=Halorhodospira halochloris TaxID=1052 RepID=A0A0X8X727_HALHR|nr:protein-L-isoaspartate O-methyltransferase [Halorhodospira halochloris]MBK1650692.1 protein-L-isoaspartate O-methyltransferase [Halorhodospira halochloris]BAU56820.1 protein-L-isoaspartate O-methyltransferase [Halorhodospira halochloris]